MYAGISSDLRVLQLGILGQIATDVYIAYYNDNGDHDDVASCVYITNSQHFVAM